MNELRFLFDSASLLLGPMFLILLWAGSSLLESNPRRRWTFRGLLLLLVLLSGFLELSQAVDAATMDGAAALGEGPLALGHPGYFLLGASRTISLLGMTSVLLSLVIILLWPPARGVVGQKLLRWVRWSEKRDFSAARKASGHDGYVLEAPRMRIWTDIAPERHALFADVLQRCIELTEEVSGFDLSERPALRLIAFDRGEDYRRYLGRFGRLFAQSGGHYMHLPTPVVLIFRDEIEAQGGQLERVLAHECIHYLSFVELGQIREMWLSEGLAMYVPSQDERLSLMPSPAAPSVLQRADRQGRLPDEREFFQSNLVKLTTQNQDPESDAATLYYFLCGSLVGFLHRYNAAGFQQFLQAGAKVGFGPRLLRKHFGLRASELYSTHAEALRQSDPQDALPPPAAL